MLRWRSKARGHYADDRIRVSAQWNRFAHSIGVAAKEVLPERIAGHRDARPAFYIFNRRNDRAQHRLHSQRFEEPRIDKPHTDLHRFGCAYVIDLLDVDSAPL